MRTPEEMAREIAKAGFDQWPASAEILTAWRDECVEETCKERLQVEKARIVRGDFANICAYCGLEIPDGEASWENLQKHIHECLVHPLHTAEAERDVAAESARMADDRVARLVKANRELRAEVANLKGLLLLTNNEEATKLRAEVEALRADNALIRQTNGDLRVALAKGRPVAKKGTLCGPPKPKGLHKYNDPVYRRAYDKARWAERKARKAL